MNKPDITVMCSAPNNGYLNLMFTDDGCIITSRCSVKDAYKGRIAAATHLLLEVADKPISGESEDNGEEATELTYIDKVSAVHRQFTQDLCSEMVTEAAVHQMAEAGIPEELAAFAAHFVRSLEDKKLSDELGDAPDEDDDAENEADD